MNLLREIKRKWLRMKEGKRLPQKCPIFALPIMHIKRIFGHFLDVPKLGTSIPSRMLFEQRISLTGDTRRHDYEGITHHICKHPAFRRRKSEETQADIPPHPKKKKELHMRDINTISSSIWVFFQNYVPLSLFAGSFSDFTSPLSL